eukprot:GFUD01008021.1.p1 GENE.GFUD01008021.1~~GFUD01008021.1.p1  ORF type:complete len:406 (+),score=131.39 GFUD01008021.1:44-1261(+)
MRESSVDFHPHKKTHRATLSQQSNTLSDISCDTQASDIPESDHSETEAGGDITEDRVRSEFGQYGSVWAEKTGERSAVCPGVVGRTTLLPDSEWEREVVAIHLEEDVAINIEDENDGHIPGEPLKTLVSGFFLVTGFLATTISLSLTHDRVPDTKPLPDIVLDTIIYQRWGLDVSEILLMVSTGTAFLVVILHSHRLIILRRIWLLLGILYYYRAITMFITVLPKADETYICQPRSDNITLGLVVNRVMTIVSGGGLSINGKQVYCGDYIFSGHTVTLTLGYLAIKQYSPSRFFLLHWASFLTSCCGIIFLLLGRGHYSIDVVLAYWVSSRMWWTFHTMANIREVKDGGEHNMFRGLWWWHAFRYFENNIPGPLPQQYSLPLPQFVMQAGRRKKKTEGDSEGVGS